jgi:hypothetical protein
MGNEDGAAGRGPRIGTETIARPDRAVPPRRERQVPRQQRSSGDRRAAVSAAPERDVPPRAPERPTAAEPRRRVPPQGFAGPRGPVPVSGRTAAPASAASRVPRTRKPSTAPQPPLAGQAPKAQAPKAPSAPKAQALKAQQALRTLRPSPARAASRMPFLLLVCGLLSGALVCALVISTTLAEGSFRISQLQQQDNALARQRQQLEAQVAAARSAQVIEQRAYQLGMRPVDVVRFLDLRDGKVKTDATGGGAERAASARQAPGATR